MKCGHCKDKHETVAEVRHCSVIAATVVIAQVLPRTPVSEPGMYQVDGKVFLVVWNKDNTKLYAKKLTPIMKGEEVHKLVFEYDKGSIFTIAAEDRMTVEQLAEMGQTTGHCWVCARKLTVQKSIKAGIGPICATRV